MFRQWDVAPLSQPTHPPCLTLRARLCLQVVGFKVGCTSAAIRTQLGLKESVHGYLWESEQYSAGCVLSSNDFYGIAIEGELAVRILSMPLASTSASATALASPEEWEVEYFPTIELHHGKLDGNRHAKAAEIVARNCIHAGVVHCGKVKKCKLKDIPLNTPINVRIGGKLIEAPVLKELALEGKEGPVGSVTFLIRRLAESRLEHPDAAVPTLKEGACEAALPNCYRKPNTCFGGHWHMHVVYCKMYLFHSLFLFLSFPFLFLGMLVMTATPGRLLPVNVEIGTASVGVDVEFGGLQVSCTITP